jgi:hypothetical protein
MFGIGWGYVWRYERYANGDTVAETDVMTVGVEIENSKNF